MLAALGVGAGEGINFGVVKLVGPLLNGVSFEEKRVCECSRDPGRDLVGDPGKDGSLDGCATFIGDDGKDVSIEEKDVL